MVYKVIGLMSGSSLDGLDIAYVHLQERTGTAKGPKSWEYSFVQTATYAYPAQWRERLAAAPGLSAMEYQLLHTDYGHYLGELVLRFIEEYGLHFQVQLIASHGHTAFHMPARKMPGQTMTAHRMTAQLGDGAALAAVTRINVVSDLRAMDIALGGQGAPIVPVGEKLLLPGYDLFLNLGGIANVSRFGGEGTAAGGVGGVAVGDGAQGGFVAFDVCPANRVLNALAALEGLAFDNGGALAASGRVDVGLLEKLNTLDYYSMPYPKSLANEFGTGTVFPLVMKSGLPTADALRTYVEHIVVQIGRAVKMLMPGDGVGSGGVDPVGSGAKVSGAADSAGSGGAKVSGVAGSGVAGPAGSGGAKASEAADSVGAGAEGAAWARLLATGGGVHNSFLVGRLQEELSSIGVELIRPDPQLIDHKEALVMALIGVLRWREENNVFASVTGATRDSIGGAVWIGQEG